MKDIISLAKTKSNSDLTQVHTMRNGLATVEILERERTLLRPNANIAVSNETNPA
jgi:hypothetical protein